MPQPADIKRMVLSDPTLTPEEHSKLEFLFKDDRFFDRLMQGMMGASLAYGIAKFLNLNRTTQLILTAAGFGLGRMIAKHLREQEAPKEKEPVSHDSKTNVNTVNL